MIKPISKSNHIGIARNNCEKTSGGVKSIPTKRKNTIKYGLALFTDFLEAIPLLTKSRVAIGISKAIPKAKTSLNTKLRYWLISVIIRIDPGAISIKNLKTIGQTIKKAKLIPEKNKITVDIINGAAKPFSLSKSPGDIYIQIW